MLSMKLTRPSFRTRIRTHAQLNVAVERTSGAGISLQARLTNVYKHFSYLHHLFK